MIRQDGTIREPTLHHVNLKTIRLQQMIDWYGTVVGARPTFRNPAAALRTTTPTTGSPCSHRRS